MQAVTAASWALMLISVQANPSIDDAIGGFTVYKALRRADAEVDALGDGTLKGRFWVDGETTVSVQSDEYTFW